MKARYKTPGAIIIEGHVQGLANTRALGEACIPVFVVDKSNCIARYSKYCKGFYRCPDFRTDAFADFLIDLAQNENLKDWILIPSNDHAVKTLSRNRRRLIPYYRFTIQEESIINNIYDKVRLLEIARKCNVPVPRTYLFNDIEFNGSDLQFPLITKGREGLNFYKATGRKAFISEDLPQLLKLLNEIKTKVDIQSTFTQEEIPFDGKNMTISFTAFCDGGDIKTFWIGEKIREHPIRFGTATFCKSIDCLPLLELSRPLMKALNFTGACEVEYLFDPRDGKYKLIEINARTWLWVGLARGCGIDYAKIIYNYLNGNSMEYPYNYAVGLKWINYLTDTFTTIQMLIKRKIGIGEYVKSLKGKKIRAAWSWTDPLPGIMLLILSFYLARKRII